MKIYNYETRPAVKSRAKRHFFHFPKFLPNNFRGWMTLIVRIAAVGIVVAAALFLYYSRGLPDPNKLLERNVPESTKILARDGSLLYEIHGEIKRTQVTLDQISPFLPQATIAIEDKDFYRHKGISVTGIARSALIDLITLHKSQGASTITQQLVKNAILTKDKSWDRKIREAILAVALDARYSKNEILQMYLNEIPYGRNAYGVEAAAQSYFGKPAKDLDLAESAYLASLPQATTYYNPYGSHRDALDARKNTVLTKMREQGYITADQEQKAKAEKVDFKQTTTGIIAPHFVMYVQDYLAERYGEKTLEEGGLKVTTTLDPKLQQIAEQAVKDNMDKDATKYNAHNAALVAIDPKTGQILAMVGSKDYFGDPEPAGCTPGKNCLFEPNFNVADSERQPGSSFKPYVYVTAFKKDFKYSPASLLMDVTTDFGTYGGKDYTPHNYNGQSYGPVSMRKALAGSLNVPAVKTLALVGVDNATQTAHDLGITSPLQDCGLSLVLGGCEVKLVDHVSAFSAIANEGLRNDKTAILKVEDRNGKALEEYQDNPHQVLDPQAAYELISIMTDNNARSYIFGSNSPLILPDRVVAAKTGTTQNWHDGWTVGFTPSLAAGVWAGNNDGTLLKKGADGVFVAAPIWNEFMKNALKGTPAEEFKVPDGIQKVTVDEVSGKLPTQFTPSTKVETFASYSVPTDYDPVHITVAMDSQTNLPADSSTPPDRIVNKIYTVFHSERPNSPNWEDPVVAWAQANGYEYPTGTITVPPPQPSNGGDSGVTTDIVSPNDGSFISVFPFQLVAVADSPNTIARLDLSIDGQFYKTVTGQPYTFTIDKQLPDGPHTLAIRATDKSGYTNDTSITITVTTTKPALNLTEPSGTITGFPTTLTAESNNLYSQVMFYYQPDKGQPKLLGQASNVSHFGDTYQYQLLWSERPAPGNYRVYAQTDQGVTSSKVKVTVP